jgi:hypothetical protein
VLPPIIKLLPRIFKLILRGLLIEGLAPKIACMCHSDPDAIGRRIRFHYAKYGFFVIPIKSGFLRMTFDARP